MRLLHMKHTGSTRLSALNGRLVSDAFQCDAMRKIFYAQFFHPALYRYVLISLYATASNIL
jgi:hypothetical protein